MAPASGRGGAHTGQSASRAARWVALREPAADRRPRDHPDRAAGAAAAVLPRLVSPRSDGRDRRRRRRSRRDRADDQGALLAADLAGAKAAAAGVRRARTPRGALHHRDRQGSHRRHRGDQQPASRAAAGFGRRLPADHDGPAVQRHARRASERARRAGEPAVPARCRRPQFVRHAAHEGRGTAAGARARQRHRSRARDARHRDQPRDALRFHRQRVCPRQAVDDGVGTSAASPRVPIANRAAAPTNTPAISSSTKRCPPSGRSSPSTAASCPASPWRK